jgi:hypothetical protein
MNLDVAGRNVAPHMAQRGLSKAKEKPAGEDESAGLSSVRGASLGRPRSGQSAICTWRIWPASGPFELALGRDAIALAHHSEAHALAGIRAGPRGPAALASALALTGVRANARTVTNSQAASSCVV